MKVKGSQKVAAVNATSVPPELPPRAHSPNIFALQQLESDNAAARVAAAANKVCCYFIVCQLGVVFVLVFVFLYLLLVSLLH